MLALKRSGRCPPEDLTGKKVVRDILARAPEGEFYNVEMQVRAPDLWEQAVPATQR